MYYKDTSQDDEDLSPRKIKQCLNLGARLTRDLGEELEELAEMIPLPSEEEHEKMLRAGRPLTLEALYLGAIQIARFRLNEAAMAIERSLHLQAVRLSQDLWALGRRPPPSTLQLSLLASGPFGKKHPAGEGPGPSPVSTILRRNGTSRDNAMRKDRRRNVENLSSRQIKRRLNQRAKRISQLGEVLERLAGMIPPPSEEELQRMLDAGRPLTLEALHLAAIQIAILHLSEAALAIETCTVFSPSSFQN